MSEYTSEELEVYADDKDPMEAIEAIRREQLKVDEQSDQEEEEETDDISQDSDELDQEEDDGTTDDGDHTDKEEKEPDIEEKDSTTSDDDDNQENEDGTSDDDDNEKVPSKVRKFRASGKEYEFTEEEMLEQFGSVFGKAVDYTQKSQAIAPYRKMISAIESEGITQDQLNIAIDALKGDKGAIGSLLKTNNIDPFDLTDNTDSGDYTPNQYGKDQAELDLQDVVRQISTDQEYGVTADVVTKQWDDASRDVISSNPSLLQGLHNDVKTGLYDKIAPEAMKMQMLDGSSKPSIDYYIFASQKYNEQQEKAASSPKKVVPDAQKEKQKFDKASSEAARKRAASSTRTRQDRKGVIDYLDEDDDKFEEWLKKVHDST